MDGWMIVADPVHVQEIVVRAVQSWEAVNESSAPVLNTSRDWFVVVAPGPEAVS